MPILRTAVIDDPGEKNEEEVIMEENGAYACAANLSPTYATICAHY